MDYYSKKQYIAQVNKKDEVIGKIEKWSAHREGLLHRGFTACLFYKDAIILQHRKHPVFDGYFELTCSSHPVFVDDKLQGMVDAVFDTLKREWGVKEQDLKYRPRSKGSIYYRAKDPNSAYTEHEMCHLYVVETTRFPTPNMDFAYGYSTSTKKLIIDDRQPITKTFAPWVPKLLRLL